MEDGLVPEMTNYSRVAITLVLILVVMEDGLVLTLLTPWNGVRSVLILVVMEDGLVLKQKDALKNAVKSLNPCCNGRWSRTLKQKDALKNAVKVLILVVMEDGLVLQLKVYLIKLTLVLILVVMEDGLGLDLIRLF